MADATQRLTRQQAIPLAIGSVAGSGILFLPSAVYVAAGPESLIVWVASTLLCVPMLLMFEDMVRTNPDGDSIEAFVRLGLGDAVARCVPIMFCALVIVGLPAGAFVAGHYIGKATSAPSLLAVAAAAVLAIALLVNLAGARASNRLQTVATWALVAMATVLLVSALPNARHGLDAIAPDAAGFGAILPTVVLAFWAFAGFENLTFLSRQLRDPARDFLPVCVIALAVYGLFTILLTIGIAVSVPRADVDSVAGLLQLAGAIRRRALVIAAVTIIAFGAMVLNAVSWVWGVSNLVASSAERSIFPRAFARSNSRGVPSRALGLLAALFVVTLTVLLVFPGIVVDALATASAIFLLMYVMCIISYLRVRGLTLRSGLNAVLLVVMIASLAQSGWRAVYGLAALAGALLAQWIRRRNRTRSDAMLHRGGTAR